jgi:hypothetical protein
MGIPSGILLQRVGYKKTALSIVSISPIISIGRYLVGCFDSE